jgi:hypothetical protein
MSVTEIMSADKVLKALHVYKIHSVAVKVVSSSAWDHNVITTNKSEMQVLRFSQQCYLRIPFF